MNIYSEKHLRKCYDELKNLKKKWSSAKTSEGVIVQPLGQSNYELVLKSKKDSNPGRTF